MGGTELVYNLFSECHLGRNSPLCVSNPGSWDAIQPIITAIVTAMLVKGSLTVIHFGIKVPAGIFIPTLGVGACAGRVMGIFVQYMQVRSPDARLFASCHGDLNCACVLVNRTLGGELIRRIVDRYHSWLVCHDRCSSSVVWCYGTCCSSSRVLHKRSLFL